MSDEYIKKEDVLKFIEDIKCNPDIPKNYGTLIDIMRYIRKMPTYDADKVVGRLICESINCHIMTDRAIEIVKSGGVADD